MESKTYYSKKLILMLAAASVITLCGCGSKSGSEEIKQPENVIEFETPEVTAVTPEPAKDEKPEETTEPAEQTGREDGERFEETIILEGMEETVKYEHVKDTALGFEMDYDYESFTRQKEADCEKFISVYDDPEDPQNYLTISHVPESADLAEEAVSTELSETYEVIRENRTLEKAGSCVVIDASADKGGETMPDRLQAVYIIPAGSGSIVARANYVAEAAEGFGRRFSYMLDTLSVTGQTETGKITKEQAVEAIKKYCLANNPDLEAISGSDEHTVYWDASLSDSGEIVVLYRSYTGAQIRYYINPETGEAYTTELVPGIIDEEQKTDETLNVNDYLK
ncbi:MAG: hypothetical protein K6E49_05000 [Lachnospiraceae bacterium]|nr:hypothetical protein [Lachnospiraceae bacterium]